MSGGDPRAIYSELKDRRDDISREIAAVESALRAAAPYFTSLSHSLNECQVEDLDWGSYRRLISELPLKASRYEELKLGLAEVQAQLEEFVGFD